MTTLGKILVIVNLVFSVLTGALIIMVFVTRTNWRTGFEKEQTNNKALQERNNRLVADMKSVRDEADKKVKDGLAELETTKTELAQITKQKNDVEEKFRAEALLKSRGDATANGISQSELTRRRDEVAKLEKQLADYQLEVARLQTQARELSAQSTKSTIEANSLRERNQQLVDQIAQLAQEIERRKNGAGGAAVAGGMPNNPPPEDVRGVIKTLDAASGLVTISVGSDAGLSVGNTMEAFRFKPKPTYLGRIQIMDVRHHEAVGKLISTQRRGLMQVGDEVASRIMGER